jgi:hypothetical protein
MPPTLGKEKRWCTPIPIEASRTREVFFPLGKPCLPHFSSIFVEHRIPNTHQNVASRESTDEQDFAPYIVIHRE